MSATNSASTRICPVCNAPNSNLSLFCAECGSSLNAPESDDTAAYTPLKTSDDDAQRTAAFEPGSFTTESPAPPRTESDTPANGYRSTWKSPAVTPESTPAPAAPTWSAANVRFEPTSKPQSIRGFVLGLVAVLLILAVFLVWTWAALLDQETRDAIRDFFGFMG